MMSTENGWKIKGEPEKIKGNRKKSKEIKGFQRNSKENRGNQKKLKEIKSQQFVHFFPYAPAVAEYLCVISDNLLRTYYALLTPCWFCSKNVSECLFKSWISGDFIRLQRAS